MILRIPDKPMIAVAVAGAVAFAAYQSVASPNGSRATLGNACASMGTSALDQMDALLATSAQSGNTAIVCRNIGSAPWLENVVASLYFRGSYVVLPHRIYVAPAATVVNEGKDFAGLGWEPSADVLSSDDIRAVILVSQDPTGAPSVTVNAVGARGERPQP